MSNPHPVPFKKTGAAANPNGRPREPWSWSGLIREAMERKNLDGEPIKEAVANALVDKAIQGDVAAIKEIGNRIDGMPVQKNIVAGDDEHPLRIDAADTLNRIYGDDSSGTVHTDSSQ
jgi:hypothetical protein